jgi:hypothetical protein
MADAVVGRLHALADPWSDVAPVGVLVQRGDYSLLWHDFDVRDDEGNTNDLEMEGGSAYKSTILGKPPNPPTTVGSVRFVYAQPLWASIPEVAGCQERR